MPNWKPSLRKRMARLSVFLAAVVAAALAHGADPGGGPDARETRWPLWDGRESVAAYAERAGIRDVTPALDLGGGVSMKLTLIPAGRFVMGDRDKRSETIEGVEVAIQQAGNGPYWGRPDREVTISQPFYMGSHEVTQEQYDRIMGPDAGREGRYDATKGMPRAATLPEGVLSWREAAAFCETLSAKTGMHVWLPTEAQWEYACRAGSTTIFPWGNDPADVHAHCNVVLIRQGETLATAERTSGFRGYAPVGSFMPNAWGLFDMLGNAEEWCHDWYTPNYLGAPTIDPAGPGVCIPESGGWCHVWRGGHFGSKYGPHHPRGRPLHHAFPRNGFRVVVALQAATATPGGAVASWVLGKGGHLLEPPSTTGSTAAREGPVPTPRDTSEAVAEEPADPAAGPAADLGLRVPPGCRALSGMWPDAAAGSGWAPAVVHEATGLEMVYIPAGSFLMGSPPDGTLFKPDTERFHAARVEKPHRVTLTRGFYLGKHELTQAQWVRVMGYNPSLFKNAGPDAPVETVSWDDCQAFCKQAGDGLRLPTEAEWEYACRAGTEGPYAGDLDEMGWHLGNSAGTPHPVGRKKPNAWGLHDMHGNVREWCQDLRSIEYPDEAVTDPTGAAKRDEYNSHMLRGGSWADYAFFCRSAARCGYAGTWARGGPGTRNIWESAEAEAENDGTLTVKSNRSRFPPYGLRPDVGCRLAITAAAGPD